MSKGDTYECQRCHAETHTTVHGLCWACAHPRKGMLESQRQISAEYQAIYAELGMTR